jgi:hypothetical protein
MRNPLTSFVLLLILGFGLIMGHLPCRPAETAREAGTEVRACHASEAPADALALQEGSAASGHDCCSDEHGVCQHACHMIADVRGGTPRFTMQMSARMLPVLVSRSLSLHPQPIDHIPLA